MSAPFKQQTLTPTDHRAVLFDLLMPKLSNDQCHVQSFIRAISDPNTDQRSSTESEQINEKQYEAALIAKGINKNRIRKYGFAFKGKEVLIGS